MFIAEVANTVPAWTWTLSWIELQYHAQDKHPSQSLPKQANGRSCDWVLDAVFTPKNKEKNYRKGKETLPFSQWLGGKVIFYESERKVCMDRHFSTCHKKIHSNCKPDSALRAEKACELMAAVFFHEAGEVTKKQPNLLIEGLVAFLQILCSKMRRLSRCHIHSSTMVRIVLAMPRNLTEKLDWDLVNCRWCSIRCNESLDSSSTLKVMMFIHTMRWRGPLWRKRYLWKNWCWWLKMGLAPWWANVQALQCKGDTGSPKFWHYHHHSPGNMYKSGQLLSWDDSCQNSKYLVFYFEKWKTDHFLNVIIIHFVAKNHWLGRDGLAIRSRSEQQSGP